MSNNVWRRNRLNQSFLSTDFYQDIALSKNQGDKLIA